MLEYPGTLNHTLDTNPVTPTTLPVSTTSTPTIPYAARAYAPQVQAAGGPVVVGTFSSGGTALKHACVAPNGYVFVADQGNTTGNSVRVLHPITGALVATIAVGDSGQAGARSLCYVPTVNRIFAATDYQKVWVIDPDDFSVKGTFTHLGTGTPESIIWVPYQNCLYIGFNGGTGVQQVTSLTATGGTPGSVVTTEAGGAAFVCHCPSNNRVYTANGSGFTLNYINPSSNLSAGFVTSVQITNNPAGIAYCPLNDRIYACCQGTAPGTGSRIVVIDPVANTLSTYIAISSLQPYGICYNPRTRLLYVTCAGGVSNFIIVNPTNNTAYTSPVSLPTAAGSNNPCYNPITGNVLIPLGNGSITQVG